MLQFCCFKKEWDKLIRVPINPSFIHFWGVHHLRANPQKSSPIPTLPAGWVWPWPAHPWVVPVCRRWLVKKPASLWLAKNIHKHFHMMFSCHLPALWGMEKVLTRDSWPIPRLRVLILCIGICRKPGIRKQPQLPGALRARGKPGRVRKTGRLSEPYFKYIFVGDESLEKNNSTSPKMPWIGFGSLKENNKYLQSVYIYIYIHVYIQSMGDQAR